MSTLIVDQVEDQAGNLITVPVGGIIMWSGSILSINNLPGWKLCDGTNGTPDLRDKFLVGAGSGYAVGAFGGSADATLPSHTHTVTGNSSGAGGGIFKAFFISINRVLRYPSNDAIDGMTEGGDFSDYPINPPPPGAIGSSSVSRGQLDSAGTSATDKNLPPYYALAFIMRIA